MASDTPTDSDLVDRLVAHRTLAAVPREQLAWLAAHGRLLAVGAGDTIMRVGAPVDHLWVVLSGRFSIRVPRTGGTGWRKVMEWTGGDVGGTLPFSRMRGSPGEVDIEEPCEILAVHRECFPDLIRECQDLTATLVHLMLDRARHFRTTDLHDDKMAALGRLAAGLAHELNNPASAAVRSAAVLATRLEEAEAAFHRLGSLRLDEAQLAALAALRESSLATPPAFPSPLAEAERHDELAGWLRRHDLEDDHAPALADTGVTIASLDAAAGVLGSEALAVSIAALAATCGTRRLAAEIEHAADRVHELVAAIKGFSYMDQAAAPKPVDVARGLGDTLTLLRAKAKAKSVRLTLKVEPGLPEVDGLGGELNQVWSNLIDNAIDAVATGGRVDVTAQREGNTLVVSIVDDGPGVPPALRERVFEPFFTTKPVGEGTGLGLAISRTLIEQHNGELDLDSRPGRTELRVTLPISDSGAFGHAPGNS